jgi:hypothetical protein
MVVLDCDIPRQRNLINSISQNLLIALLRAFRFPWQNASVGDCVSRPYDLFV